MTRRRWLLLVATLVALLLLAGRFLAAAYVDFHWYHALGASSVWRERASNSLLLWGGSATAGMLFFFANLYAVRRSVVTLILPRRVANLEIGEEVPRRLLTASVAVASAVLGAALTMPAAAWTTLALARHGLPFGDPVPYLELDLSFFVYWLPFEHSVYAWSRVVLLVAVAIVVFLYALTPSLRWDRGQLRMSTHVRRHLSILGAIVLLLLAWNYRLDAFAALVHGSGPDGFVTPVDRAVALQLAPWLQVVCVISSIIVVFSGWRGQVRVVVASLTLVLASSLIVAQAFPALARRFTQAGQWAALDTAAQENRAIYSRRAFASDEIVGGTSGLTFVTWAEALPWLSSWDPQMLVRAVRASGATAAPVGDVAWWPESGGLAAVVAEPPSDLATVPSAPWTLALVPSLRAGQSAADAHAADAGPVVVRRAAKATLIYPGAAAPLVVADSANAFAAAPVSGLVSRIAHAWSEQEPQLLAAPRLPHARIIRLRDVRARLREVAPFFSAGSAAIPVLSGDTIVWVVDLYAASADYPFSLRMRIGGEERSYYHHAATALVNGFTGHVRLVRDRSLEPIAATWVSRFPELFVDWDEVPSELASFVPPALDGARLAAYVFARYGERAASPLPLGDLAPGLVDSAFATGVSLTGLPGPRPVAAWVWPVLDAGDRIRGLVVARGGRERTITWQAIGGLEGQWHTWLERLGSTVDSIAAMQMPDLTSGAVRAVPIGGSVALYKTWYRVAPGGAPTIHRVAIATLDTVRAGATLADAVGGSLITRGPAAAGAISARLAALYDRMRDALRRADWVAFGAAMDSLGMLLGRRVR